MFVFVCLYLHRIEMREPIQRLDSWVLQASDWQRLEGGFEDKE